MRPRLSITDGWAGEVGSSILDRSGINLHIRLGHAKRCRANFNDRLLHLLLPYALFIFDPQDLCLVF